MLHGFTLAFSEELISSKAFYFTLDFVIVYAVLPLAIWITVQIAFILTGVYFPFYGQRILASKWKRRSLHVFALVLGLLFPLPTIIVSSTKGHSLFGPTFPPVVCTSQRRDIMIFTWLIPVNVLLAVIITMLIFIFYKVIKVRTFQINDNNIVMCLLLVM